MHIPYSSWSGDKIDLLLLGIPDDYLFPIFVESARIVQSNLGDIARIANNISQHPRTEKFLHDSCVGAVRFKSPDKVFTDKSSR